MHTLLTRRTALFRPLPTRRYKSTDTSAALSPRWLSDVKSRIGKCIMFGIDSAQTQEAGSILQETSRDWRELVAGSEGYLTAKEWRGLYRQEVVWGEMVDCNHLPKTVDDG
jgi:LmbE family N-acetylglucosaminyl deacetylase